MGEDKNRHFNYKPLDPTAFETRLLTVFPRTHAHDEIHCRLENVTCHLDTLPRPTPAGQRPPYRRSSKYFALSYTWGSPDKQRSITVDGQLFSVRSNLHDFLEEYWLSLDPRGNNQRVWIDQICISQSDHAERAYQISLMAEIYKYASRVVIWLGHGFSGSDALLRDMQHLQSTNSKEAQKRNAQALEAHLPALHQIIMNKYWTRLWIHQEVMLAKKLSVQIGQTGIAWTYFTRISHGRFIPCASNRTAAVVQAYTRITSLANNVTVWHENGFDWQSALKAVQHAECGHVLDQVYGVLGMLKPRVRVSADYGRSRVEVFEEVVLKTTLPNGNFMDMLEERLELRKLPGFSEPELRDVRLRLVERLRGKGNYISR